MSRFSRKLRCWHRVDIIFTNYIRVELYIMKPGDVIATRLEVNDIDSARIVLYTRTRNTAHTARARAESGRAILCIRAGGLFTFFSEAEKYEMHYFCFSIRK